MFVRALLAFMALPGVVAFVVPALLAGDLGRLSARSAPGVAVGAGGVVVLLACVRSFYVEGKGTLAPWAPPQHLVQGGLYRLSRNPMYVGVLLVLAGWALAFWSTTLAIYAIGIAIAFHLRVIYGEEPVLSRHFGATWEAYRHAVPRWLWR